MDSEWVDKLHCAARDADGLPVVKHLAALRLGQLILRPNKAVLITKAAGGHSWDSGEGMTVGD